MLVVGIKADYAHSDIDEDIRLTNEILNAGDDIEPPAGIDVGAFIKPKISRITSKPETALQGHNIKGNENGMAQEDGDVSNSATENKEDSINGAQTKVTEEPEYQHVEETDDSDADLSSARAKAIERENERIQGIQDFADEFLV